MLWIAIYRCHFNKIDIAFLNVVYADATFISQPTNIFQLTNPKPPTYQHIHANKHFSIPFGL